MHHKTKVMIDQKSSTLLPKHGIILHGTGLRCDHFVFNRDSGVSSGVLWNNMGTK